MPDHVAMETKTRATIEDLYKVEGKAELVNGEIVHMPPCGDGGWRSMIFSSNHGGLVSTTANSLLTDDFLAPSAHRGNAPKYLTSRHYFIRVSFSIATTAAI